MMSVMSYGFVPNFICFPALQNFWKSVKIWQRYRQFKGWNFFETQCTFLIWQRCNAGRSVWYAEATTGRRRGERCYRGEGELELSSSLQWQRQDASFALYNVTGLLVWPSYELWQVIWWFCGHWHPRSHVLNQQASSSHFETASDTVTVARKEHRTLSNSN